MKVIQQARRKCWQDMERSEKIEKLINENLFSDCEFIVGPEDSTAVTICGHKLFFMLESPVFENMMSGSFLEAKPNQQIRIYDIFPHDFKNFRSLIYTNSYEKYSEFSIQEIFELYRIADKYLVSSVLRDSIDYLSSLIDSVSVQELCTLFEFAFEIENKIFLSSIKQGMSKKHAPESLLHKDINRFSPELFFEYMLFMSHNTNVKPLSMFSAVEYYMKSNDLIKNDNAPLKNENPIGTFEKYNEEIMQVEELLDEAVNENIEKKNEIEIHESSQKDELKKEFKTEEKFNSSKFLDKLLKLVKFEAMSAQEFVNGPGKSCLLEYQEKYKFLVKLSTKNLVQSTNHRLGY